MTSKLTKTSKQIIITVVIFAIIGLISLFTGDSNTGFIEYWEKPIANVTIGDLLGIVVIGSIFANFVNGK